MTLFGHGLNVELLLAQCVAWLPSLFLAIVILVGFWLMFRITRAPLARILARAAFDKALIGMLVRVYRFTLLGFAVITAASQVGINVGAALAGLGVVGLAIGFAAKDTLSNIIAGFLIFWDRPFRVGDWVSVGGHYGRVAEITMRTTRVCTRNNTWIIMPNETVINQVLVNHSTNGRTRLEVPVAIAYKEDIDRARNALVGALRSLEGLSKDQPATVIVDRLNQSSVDLLVQAWIPDAQEERPAYAAILETAKRALDSAGIEIPFPHMQLIVNSVDRDVWRQAGEMAQAYSAFRAGQP